MFRFVRVQVLYPCQGRCSWCATHRRNPLFLRLHERGIAGAIYDFYVDVISRLRPKEVFVSGGEPLLYPEIAELLQRIARHTPQINLFTSYQFSATTRQGIAVDRLPLDRIVFCHTPIYFDPRRWPELTGDVFSFDEYVDNIRFFARLPARKRFKFIINHDDFVDEVRLFQQLVTPDRSFQLGLKVINDQGDGLMRRSMERTRDLVNERVAMLDALVRSASWGSVGRKAGSLDQMAPLLHHGDPSRCVFAHSPVELRFALDRKARRGRPVLRYRYCPYFPPSFGHRFHVGRDDPAKLERNYFRGPFRRHCADCRFLRYHAHDLGSRSRTSLADLPSPSGPARPPAAPGGAR